MSLRSLSLAGLRVSLGLLMVTWGLDKVFNTEHALRVSEGFYLGIVSSGAIWKLLGVGEVILGVLVVVGLMRVLAYPVMLIANGISLLAVWKSLVDPLGFFLEGTNILFFPATTVFFGVLVVWSFRKEDVLSLDERRRGRALRG